MHREKLYIGGRWVSPSSAERIDVVNPTTEEVLGSVPAGTPQDADEAAAAAKDAFGSWAETSVDKRAKYLRNVSEALQARSEEIADLVTREVGMPLDASIAMQAGLPVVDFQSVADLIESMPMEESVGNSLVLREPVGVVAAITPWNYPLHQVSAKVAPALAVGCTVVLKPSEVAPLTAFILAEVMEDVGLPAGVFNLVTGFGPVVGEALASHRFVDMVTFTGSTRAGKRVSELASQTVKRVTLELGGKSAYVLLEDGDVGGAVSAALNWCYLNSGQTCSAFTRLLVPRSRMAEAEAAAVEITRTFVTGDPFQPGTRVGPVVSDVQRERVRGYIQAGIDEGAKLVTGGLEPPAGLDRGYFVQPTVFSDVKPGMKIEQEEIFGPVLTIVPYDSEAEAVEIANGTMYGLAAGVWSADVEKATATARRLRAGQVEINGGEWNPLAPFGGYKQSGNGRELGKFGIEEYLETKSLQL